MPTGTGAGTGAGNTTDEDNIADTLGLKVGVTVKSAKASYEILKVLGEGGFGAVFKVKDKLDEKKLYAMKVEPRSARKHNKLKMEIDILKRVSTSERKPHSHFTEIIDRGKEAEKFVFVVMDLVGPSLADLKDVCAHRIFPLATGLGVALQCLEALEDLHKHGFIHRDLKPANYARGRGDKRHVIYMLDFGIARKLTNTSNELKTPRGNVNFKGTVRFASRNCHRNKDLGFADDCESWFYLLLDLIVEGGLPWKRIEGKDEVLAMKNACAAEKKHLIAQKLACREKLLIIMDYLNGLQYQNVPDYGYLYELIRQAARISQVDIDAPYYWEKNGEPSK